jgi:hypothetical protein
MTETTTGKTNRWMKAALVVSLALNLAILMAIGGAVWRFGPPPGEADRFRAKSGPVMYVAALDRAERKALFNEARQNGVPKRSTPPGEGVIAALKTQPFDVAAFEAAIDEEVSVVDRRSAALLQGLVARVAAMDEDEREAYADRIEEFARHARKHDRMRRSE